MASLSEKWMLLSVILLNAYSVGANCVERFVNYGSWPLLAAADFGPYHRSQQRFVLGFVVAPLVLSLMLQSFLLFRRPAQVPLWIVLTLIATSAAGFLCTVAIQIPIHRQLDHGYSRKLVDRLLKTDWIRKVLDLVRLGATVVLMLRCLA